MERTRRRTLECVCDAGAIFNGEKRRRLLLIASIGAGRIIEYLILRLKNLSESDEIADNPELPDCLVSRLVPPTEQLFERREAYKPHDITPRSGSAESLDDTRR